MIQVADNFNYRGKKPNFDRDSFDTLQDMKNYSENSLDDGHISYCKETNKHYKFNSNNQSDPTTGKWVEQHEAVPADEEDITEQNGTLQLANKTYDKQSFSGLGRVYLRKNLEVMEILSIDLLQIDAILVLCILILHQVNLYSIKIILSGQMLQELLYNNKIIKIWHSMQLKMN